LKNYFQNLFSKYNLILYVQNTFQNSFENYFILYFQNTFENYFAHH